MQHITSFDDPSLAEATHDVLAREAIVSETDLAGAITYVNDNFLKVTGYTRKELLGKTHNHVNSGHHTLEFFRHLWQTLSGGKPWRGVICDLTKDGEEIWLDSLIFPVLNRKGSPTKYVAIRFDVTPYMKN